jgi:hypothetical protein
MNLSASISLYAGGPGSGCQGENCGRPKTGLQRQLDHISKTWGPNDTWAKLGKYGHPGTIAPFSKEELKVLKALKPPSSCKVGFCFQNAQQIANFNRDDRLKYVEGLVTVFGVPLDHAWIEFNGKVYDPTLAYYKPDQQPNYERPTTKGRFLVADPDREYVGVVVPKDEISQHQFRTGVYSPLSQEHRNTELQKRIWK